MSKSLAGFGKRSGGKSFYGYDVDKVVAKVLQRLNSVGGTTIVQNITNTTSGGGTSDPNPTFDSVTIDNIVINGDTIEFGNTLSGSNCISIPDNLLSALKFNQASNDYLTFTTTDNDESVKIGAPILDMSTNFTGGTPTIKTIEIVDNVSTALTIAATDGNQYLTFDTTNSGERLVVNADVLSLLNDKTGGLSTNKFIELPFDIDDALIFLTAFDNERIISFNSTIGSKELKINTDTIDLSLNALGTTSTGKNIIISDFSTNALNFGDGTDNLLGLDTAFNSVIINEKGIGEINEFGRAGDDTSRSYRVDFVPMTTAFSLTFAYIVEVPNPTTTHVGGLSVRIIADSIDNSNSDYIHWLVPIYRETNTNLLARTANAWTYQANTTGIFNAILFIGTIIGSATDTQFLPIYVYSTATNTNVHMYSELHNGKDSGIKYL